MRPNTAPFASCVILLGGIATIAFSAYLVVVSYSSLPYWDGWGQIDFGAQGRAQSTLTWLWTLHSEHRLVIPRLFLLADLRWFHATQVFLLASIFVIQLLHLALLGWSMRVFGGWRGSLWRTGVGLTAFCLFCPSQWENFTWGFQTCFVLPGFFATLSWIGLLLYWLRSGEELGRYSSWKYLVLSIGAALGATYSLSNGNLLWPLLVAAALLLRLRLAAVLSLLIAGILSTALYLNNYFGPAAPPSSAETLVQSLKYLLAYFGSSWVGSNIPVAEVIGVAGLAAFLVSLLRLLSYIRSRRPFSIQLVLTLLFCVGTGMVTAMGRSGFGVSQAFSSRYQTVSLLFWCCLGLLVLGAASALHRWSSVAVPLAQVLLLAIMLVGAKRAEIPLIRARVRSFKLNTAAMSLVTQVPDTEQLQWADSHPDYVLSLTPYMRQERLSVFSEPESWVLGEPLDSAFRLAVPNECAGALESNVAMGGAASGQAPLRITGWAWDLKHRRPPASIVAVTGGVITGLGAMGDWRPLDQVTRPGVTTNYIGYTGYVQGGRAPGPVEIYAILPGKPASACLIATVK